MRRAALWLALSAAILAQEPADIVTLLLKGGASVTGRVVRVEKDGVLLRSELGGESVERLWTWEQVDDADPLKPRAPAAAADLVAGVEVDDGVVRVRGVVVSRSLDLLIVQDRNGNHRFDPSRVRVTDVWLAGREVLDEGPGRAALPAPETLKTPSDHRRAAAEAARAGRDKEANDLLRVAEVLSEIRRPDQEVFRSIALLRVGTPERSQAVWGLRRRVLDQSYEDAIADLDRMEAQGMDAGPAAEDVRRELSALQRLPVEARIVLYHDAMASEEVWRLAQDGSIGWKTASEQVRDELSARLCRLTAARFSIDEETARRTWEGRPEDRRLAASWGTGSFLASGEGSSADCEAWWSSAPAEDRYAALRALAAEVSGQVLEVISKDCAGCGGRGEKGGRTCGRCMGGRTERVVLYR